MQSVTSNAVADSYVITEVYSYSTNKLVVVKPKNIDIYIFYFYGAKITDFENAISNLGITTQKVQTGFVSRRDSRNSYVFPCTVVLSTIGTVGAWYASGGIEYTLGINDIIYGQMVICKN